MYTRLSKLKSIVTGIQVFHPKKLTKKNWKIFYLHHPTKVSSSLVLFPTLSYADDWFISTRILTSWKHHCSDLHCGLCEATFLSMHKNSHEPCHMRCTWVAASYKEFNVIITNNIRKLKWSEIMYFDDYRNFEKTEHVWCLLHLQENGDYAKRVESMHFWSHLPNKQIIL